MGPSHRLTLTLAVRPHSRIEEQGLLDALAPRCGALCPTAWLLRSATAGEIQHSSFGFQKRPRRRNPGPAAAGSSRAQRTPPAAGGLGRRLGAGDSRARGSEGYFRVTGRCGIGPEPRPVTRTSPARSRVSG